MKLRITRTQAVVVAVAISTLPLSGAKRTSKFKSVTSAFDPKQTLAT